VDVLPLVKLRKIQEIISKDVILDGNDEMMIGS